MSLPRTTLSHLWLSSLVTSGLSDSVSGQSSTFTPHFHMLSCLETTSGPVPTQNSFLLTPKNVSCVLACLYLPTILPLSSSFGGLPVTQQYLHPNSSYSSAHPESRPLILSFVLNIYGLPNHLGSQLSDSPTSRSTPGFSGHLHLFALQNSSLFYRKA